MVLSIHACVVLMFSHLVMLLFHVKLTLTHTVCAVGGMLSEGDGCSGAVPVEKP